MISYKSILFFFRLFFDSKRKIGYCEIPKMASSTWKSVLAKYTKSGQNYTVKELGTKMFIHKFIDGIPDIHVSNYDYNKHKNYRFFMAVRNPFDRLVSTYYNKVFPWRRYDGKLQIYYRRIQKYVLKTFEHHDLTGFQRNWYNASFTEFINYTLSVKNGHWTSLEYFCEPCRITYDYILRVETMERDSQVLMSDLYPEAGPIPVANAARKKSNSASSTSHLIQPKTLDIFSQLPRKTLEKLMKKYAWDLEFYGDRKSVV